MPEPRAYIFTFPYWIWTSRHLTRLIEYDYENHRVRVYPPFRMASANFHPAPLLNPRAVPFLSDAQPDLRLLVTQPFRVYPRIEDQSVIVARGAAFDENIDAIPADAVRIDALDGSAGEHRPLAYLHTLLEHIRVVTGQWWIGTTGAGPFSRNGASFKMTERGEPIDTPLVISLGLVMEKHGESLLDDESWLEVGTRVARGDSVRESDSRLLDALDAIADSRIAAAVLDTAIACELATTAAAARIWSLRDARPFKTSRIFRSDDLRRRLDHDLKRLAGASFAAEEPGAFQDLSQLWLARNAVAHGGPAVYRSGDRGRSVTTADAHRFVRAAKLLVGWLDQLLADAT